MLVPAAKLLYTTREGFFLTQDAEVRGGHDVASLALERKSLFLQLCAWPDTNAALKPILGTNYTLVAHDRSACQACLRADAVALAHHTGSQRRTFLDDVVVPQDRALDCRIWPDHAARTEHGRPD